MKRNGKGRRQRATRWLIGLGFLLMAMAIQAQDREHDTMSLLYEPEEVVSAAAIPAPPLESPAIVTVVTREQMIILGVRTLPELLETVPGFSPWRSVAGDWWPGARGIFDTNRNFLVMIDGISINNQFMGSPFYSYDLLDLSRFSRIEIIRGPGSAMYGANALLAVINCITRETLQNEGKIRTLIGSFGTKGIGIARAFRQRRTLVDFELSGMSGEGPHHQAGPDVYGKTGYTHEGFTKKDLFLKLSNPNGWTFLGSHVAGNREGYMGYFDHLNSNTFFERKNTLLSLKFQKKLPRRGEVVVKTFWNHFSDDELTESVAPGGTWFNGVTYPFGATERDRFEDHHKGISLNWIAPLVKRHQFSLGFETAIIDLQKSGIYGSYDFPLEPGRRVFVPNGFPKPEMFRTRSFMIQDDIKLDDRTRLTAGVRQENHSLYGNTASPRFGLIRRWHKNLTTKLLYGEAFRNPDFYELTVKRDLRPEKMKTSELQFLGELPGGWIAKLNYFYNQVNDRIASAKFPGDYQNIRENRYDGLEFELRKHFSRGRELFCNVSTNRILHASSDPLQAPGVPHNRINAGYRFALKPWDICLWGSVTADQPRNWADSRPPVDGLRLAHLVVRHKSFLTPKGDLVFRVRNLFNHPYEFVTQAVPGGIDTFPQAGREVSLEMTWELP